MRKRSDQARRQDSVTGGINKFLGGTRSLFCVNSRGAQGHKKFIPVWMKWTRWGAKSQRDFPAEIANSSGFSGRKQVISKKKGSSSQKRHKIWCKSSKNTNLDLDLCSKSPDPVNFFGAQSSLGGAQFSFGRNKHSVGGAYRGCGAGSASDTQICKEKIALKL